MNPQKPSLTLTAQSIWLALFLFCARSLAEIALLCRTHRVTLPQLGLTQMGQTLVAQAERPIFYVALFTLIPIFFFVLWGFEKFSEAYLAKDRNLSRSSVANSDLEP